MKKPYSCKAFFLDNWVFYEKAINQSSMKYQLSKFIYPNFVTLD